MEQYISKSALVAEIRRMIKNSELYIKHHHDNNDRLRYSFEHQRLAMCELLSFIDTLEVKEVDLEKEVDEHWDEWAKEDGFHSIDFAKHFFELGLSVNNKAQKGKKV